jgi:CheY-like chemotaxis protein
LVVDDSEINLVIATRLLELHGANVATAQDGQEAIDVLSADPDAFDVVLMDVQMPRLDGNEATMRLRQRPELARMPIIAVTAGAMANERARVLEAGMNAFISKPFDAEAVVNTVYGLVKRARDASLIANDVRRPPLPSRWPLLAGINAHEVCARLGGDIALFQSLLKRMLHDFDAGALPREAPPLAAERRELAQRLHKLYGVSSALGATRLAARARELEKALRSEGGDEDLSPRLAQLTQELARLRAAASRVLSSAFPERPLPSDPPRELDPEALAQLAEFLRTSDLEATPLFERLAPALRTRLDERSFARLREAIERLDFASALLLLPASAANLELSRAAG